MQLVSTNTALVKLHAEQTGSVSLSEEKRIMELARTSGIVNPTSSGINVTPEVSLGLADVYACIKVLAEDCATLPLITYYRQSESIRRRAADLPLYTLLHDLPNNEMTAFSFRCAMVANQALWGNCYAEIVDDSAGRVTALYPLPAKLVTPCRNSDGIKYGGRLFLPSLQPTDIVYRVEVPGGPVSVLPAYRVLHIPALSFDGIVGRSPITIARETLGLGLAAEQYGGKFFGGGGQPRGVLKHPGELSGEAGDRLRQRWSETYEGLANAQRVALLEEGMTYEKISVPPNEAQFIETRKFNTAQIARLYRMPLHKIIEMGDQKWANIEQMAIEYVTGTLMPWLVNWEQALSWKLLLPQERGKIFFEFLVEGMLRGDTQTRYQAYALGIQWGFLSRNDVRIKENLEPEDGLDEYLVPVNMAPAGQPMQRVPASALQPLITDAADRVTRRERADWEREDGKQSADMRAFKAGYFAVAGEHAAWIAATLLPLLQAMGHGAHMARVLASLWCVLCEDKGPQPSATLAEMLHQAITAPAVPEE
ncbi:MAG: phage portal protein [Armatimonadota bacterium]